MGEKRHADAETINHIVDLRRRLAEAERQRDNALSVVIPMRKALMDVYWAAEDREIHNMAAKALNTMEGTEAGKQIRKYQHQNEEVEF